jgi:Kef-type K+ transport system membrane component KefB
MFMWPKTRREAYFRMATTIIVSTFVGPLLVIALRSAVPSLFVAARDGALLYGLDPAVGFLLIAAPVMVFAGLPAWWIVGALVRWLDKRKDKDIGELAADAKQTIQQLRGAA